MTKKELLALAERMLKVAQKQHEMAQVLDELQYDCQQRINEADSMMTYPFFYEIEQQN